MASSSSLRCETTTGLDGGCATGSAALGRGGFVRRVEMTFGLSAFDSSLDMRLGHQQAGDERNTFEMTDQKLQILAAQGQWRVGASIASTCSLGRDA